MTVLEFPPSEFLSSRVSFESRYPMCVRLLPDVRRVMTLPSARRDLLIPPASASLCPSAPVLATFSEPARSTRYSCHASIEKKRVVYS